MYMYVHVHVCTCTYLHGNIRAHLPNSEDLSGPHILHIPEEWNSTFLTSTPSSPLCRLQENGAGQEDDHSEGVMYMHMYIYMHVEGLQCYMYMHVYPISIQRDSCASFK